MNRLRLAVVALALLVAAPAFAQTSHRRRLGRDDQFAAGREHVESHVQAGRREGGRHSSSRRPGETAVQRHADRRRAEVHVHDPVPGQPLDITMTGKRRRRRRWPARRISAAWSTATGPRSAPTPTTTAATTTPAAATPADAPAAATAAMGGAARRQMGRDLKTPGGEFPANANLTRTRPAKCPAPSAARWAKSPVAGTLDGKR